MLPQRGIPFRPSIGPRPPVGTPSKISSLGVKSAPGAVRRPAPPKAPSSLFGEKKYWSKPEMRQSIKKISPFILKGKTFTQQQREKMIEQWFPYQKFGAYVTEQETKQALQQMRKKEFWAKSKEKKPLKSSRKLLEAFTRIRKY